jgi:hypothetical protein
MFSHVEQSCAIVPCDAIFAVPVVGQPRPECLITKALPRIVEYVDEFERTLNPQLPTFGLLLQSVFDFRPSEVEIALDVGQGADICGLFCSCTLLLQNFRAPLRCVGIALMGVE